MTTPGQNEWNDPLLEAAEHVYDGRVSPATKIDDWSRFIDILEDHDFDLGDDMLSPDIKRVKKHVRAYIKLEG